MQYLSEPNLVSPAQLEGFCIGWARPLSGEELHATLHGSYAVILAVSDGEVVGFINAISDGVLSAFIPLLEVRPHWQGRGVGQELVRLMLERLEGLYSIDLVCDEHLIPYYERFGLRSVSGMAKRNFGY